MLKSVFKFIIASILIISGILVGSTIFAAKGIDKLGDKLQDQIYR
ncbi:hypothetical protein [Liquorilactobacillus oeni]|nr:hypothetical protein [Liquorilactobacillus oeni]